MGLLLQPACGCTADSQSALMSRVAGDTCQQPYGSTLAVRRLIWLQGPALCPTKVGPVTKRPPGSAEFYLGMRGLGQSSGQLTLTLAAPAPRRFAYVCTSDVPGVTI
jgi:hypothetical protein